MDIWLIIQNVNIKIEIIILRFHRMMKSISLIYCKREARASRTVNYANVSLLDETSK